MGNFDFIEFIHLVSISLPGFLLAIVCHEAAHAWMASRFGDPTAKMQGRLTLNPAVHYDLMGTVIFPLIGAAMSVGSGGGAMFGWAKPVPVDSRRFKNIRAGIFWVSFAGPLANVVLMILSALLLALVFTKVSPDFAYRPIFMSMLKQSVTINVLLAVFNLIPFPPLDGSKMVSAMLDYNAARKFEELQRFSFVFIFILILTPVLGYIMYPALVFSEFLVNVFVHLFAAI
ncbi:MAG: site-2 protease family protein [Bacteriovorax sp.]|nr:site-2 protease family protein [Bacteriovorax sp.]